MATQRKTAPKKAAPAKKPSGSPGSRFYWSVDKESRLCLEDEWFESLEACIADIEKVVKGEQWDTDETVYICEVKLHCPLKVSPRFSIDIQPINSTP